MDNLRLNEIKERAAKATPGPWVHTQLNLSSVNPPLNLIHAHDKFGWPEEYEILNEHDAEFIAHARQDVPDLVAEVIAQKESKEKAYSQLQQKIIDKSYIMQTLDSILRICETDRDNSDLRKIEEIINETMEELEAKAYERAVHHQPNHVQCSAV